MRSLSRVRWLSSDGWREECFARPSEATGLALLLCGLGLVVECNTLAVDEPGAEEFN